MRNLFRPLSADCIDYYDLSKDQLVALSYLAANTLERNLYLKSNLAFPIGKLCQETAINLPLTPASGGQLFLAAKPMDAYGQANAQSVDKVIDEVTRGIQCQPGVTQTHMDALFDVHRSLINFDRQVIGGSKVRIGTDTDNRIISPTYMKAPIWHFDMASDQVMPANRNSILPERLKPIVRGYAIRVVSPDCTENVQPEYIRDADLFVENGRSNPLVLANREIAKKAQDFRLSFGIRTSQVGDLLETNAIFAKGWAEFLNEQQAIVSKMRCEGLVQQAQPYEILFASNYSYHCTRQPLQPLRSLFIGLQVQSLA